MSDNRLNFTNERVSKLSCPEDKRRAIFYDKEIKKLACIVSKTGIKTFALHAFDKTRKKPIQQTIGRYPEVTINNAREIAGDLLTQLAKGVDIIEAKRKIREEPSLNELFDNWLTDNQNSKKTIHEDERTYNLHIKPEFGSKQISSLTTNQVRRWHRRLPKKLRQRKKNGEKVYLSPATANRCLALLRAIINQQAGEIDNPCKQVKLFKEQSRDRFLKPNELRRFFSALHAPQTSEVLRDLTYILLFTGARRSNVFSMQWKELDFDNDLWTIPATKSKSGKKMEVPLIPIVIDVLKKRKKITRSVFVFESHGKTGHIVDPKRQWKDLLERSDLLDLRLHDLRRTCGSYQASTGANAFIIKESLGHQNISTTQIYARVDVDPVRKSMELAADKMLKAANSKENIAKMDAQNEQSK